MDSGTEPGACSNGEPDGDDTCLDRGADGIDGVWAGPAGAEVIETWLGPVDVELGRLEGESP